MLVPILIRVSGGSYVYGSSGDGSVLWVWVLVVLICMGITALHIHKGVVGVPAVVVL